MAKAQNRRRQNCGGEGPEALPVASCGRLGGAGRAEAGVGGGTAVNEVFRTKKIREGSDSRVFIVNFGSENRHDDYKSVKKHI